MSPSSVPEETPGNSPRESGWASRLVEVFIDSKLTPLVLAFSVLLGGLAVLKLPREEEPQIKVPMIDLFVGMEGATPQEVEERITKPMERFLWEIPGVEHIYSTSSAEGSLAIVRFEVGQDEEDAIVKVNQKMAMHFDLIPPGASLPLIQPRSIDDVPILSLTLWSRARDHHELRRIAGQVADLIKAVPDTSETRILGGAPRQVKVQLDAAALAAHGMAPVEVAAHLRAANARSGSGQLNAENEEILVTTGRWLKSVEDVRRVVIGAHAGRPVHLEDVARISDGPAEPVDHVFFLPGRAAPAEEPPATAAPGTFPAVTLSIAKRKGTNATVVAENVLRVVERLKGLEIPADVQVTTTRNYGETAAEKSNELLLHMGIAVISVSLLIWLVLGWREAGIVAIAIPVTLALTLTIFFFTGYTLNRITLFALIFSIGILVDDPIVDVENIVRHFRMPETRGRNLLRVTIEAVNEVRSPLILATLAVVCAVLPMAFVRGLMGPYMRPIPVGASSAMLVSMVVAFVITPWAAYRLLRGPAERGTLHASGEGHREDALTRLYRHIMTPLLTSSFWRGIFLLVLTILLLGALALVPLGKVIVKMLPFDNKSELQIVIDLPEGTPLEQSTNAAREIAEAARHEPEVTDVQVYAGVAAPFNFNGLVRHYFLRKGSNVADLQVNLVGKHERSAQSHDFAKRIRPAVEAAAKRLGARVKIAEVPPGPPVLQTIVAEIYGAGAPERASAAKKVLEVFESTPGVVDADWYLEDEQRRSEVVPDAEKAALHGVSVAAISQTLRLALRGEQVGLLHDEHEKEDVGIVLRLPREDRSRLDAILSLRVQAGTVEGRPVLVPLRELVTVEERVLERSIYHKDLVPVTYVTADVSGREESPIYAILKLRPRLQEAIPGGLSEHWTTVPLAPERLTLKWDGEMHITLEVFRDLGLAFGIVLILIYVLVVGWFRSFLVPFIIMAAIPFSLVGILPAHWAMGAFFTATSMIGFIAGAGIVVRNSIILVDFIELKLAEGMPLEAAVVEAGAIRFRPMVLTAAAVMVGAGVILFDPIFQGLALSLIAGEVASLLLSRLAVPVLYFLVHRLTRRVG